MGIPDLQFINRKIPIREVASALDLRFGDNGNVHCWHLDSHQNGDRTASVGIRKAKNTVKCFGLSCGIGPFGPADLVMDVLRLKNVGEAARWIAERFPTPEIARGKHLVQAPRRIFQFGFESAVGLLVHSGLWAQLSGSARSLVPVLLELAERDTQNQTYTIQISYRALSRYSGIASHRAIAGALRELQAIYWLAPISVPPKPSAGPVRAASTYLLTPRSNELLDLANAHCAKVRDDIEAERKLRAEQRSKRLRAVVY